jgi:hypothetical protein
MKKKNFGNLINGRTVEIKIGRRRGPARLMRERSRQRRRGTGGRRRRLGPPPLRPLLSTLHTFTLLVKLCPLNLQLSYFLQFKKQKKKSSGKWSDSSPFKIHPQRRQQL